MARKIIAAIFQDIADAPTSEDKISVLKNNNIAVIRQLLGFAYDQTLTFDTIIPDYKVNTEIDGYASNSLYTEYKRLYLFTDTYQKVSAKKKTELLSQILESIDPSDAVLLVKVVTRTMDEFGLSRDIINSAFPDLIKR